MVLASCAIGADPCADTGTGTAGLLPEWAAAIVVLGAIAAVGSVLLVARADRRRPWD